MTTTPAGAPLAVADAPAEHVTPYDRFAWSERTIERWLSSGRHAAELGAYFGAQEYRLVALARRARRCARSARAAGDPGARHHGLAAGAEASGTTAA
jgi:hypothetical protein